MNFFVFTSRSKTIPIASFLVAHSHGRNFVVKCEGNSLVWNQYITKPEEKKVGVSVPRVPHQTAHAHSCFRGAQMAKIALLALHSCLTRQLPCFAFALQLPTFCLHCSLMPRQASQSQRWNASIIALKCFHIFVHCTNLRKYSNEARRYTWQCTDIIRTISASNFCARDLCRPIVASNVAIVTCKKTCFLKSFYFNCWIQGKTIS